MRVLDGRDRAGLRLVLTLVLEDVEQGEVVPLLVQGETTAQIVCTRTQEDAHVDVGVLVAVDGDAVSEGLVVEAGLTDANLGLEGVLLGSNVDGVGHGVFKVLEEGHQLVEVDGFHLHSGKDDLRKSSSTLHKDTHRHLVQWNGHEAHLRPSWCRQAECPCIPRRGRELCG